MTAVLAPAEATAHARGAPRGRRIALALPACLPALMIAVGGWSHRWMDEDAFINFRIVDQIFAGHGPVFNAGERVEAATSPLWLFVLVVGRAVFGAFVSIEWIALVAGLVAAIGRVSRSVATRRGSSTVGAKVSCCPVGPAPGGRGGGRMGLLDVGPRDGPGVAVARRFVVGADDGCARPTTIPGRRARSGVASCSGWRRWCAPSSP